MNTFDFNRPVTSQALNESLFKQFNVKINFDKYTREDLENYRNLLRTKVNQVESQANFNDLLTDDTYQKDKFILGVLNTRINEMLGESKNVVAEKAVSKAQQKFMGMVHATQKGAKAPSKEVAKVAKGMGKKDAKDFAATKHKGLPAHKSDESVEEGTTMKTTEAKKKAKPDFLDMDKDGNKKEPMKKAVADKKKAPVKEGRMTAHERAHHHAAEYERHHKTGNLDLAMHHKDACEECGGMIQHGPMGECWHMHAGMNKGKPYRVSMGNPATLTSESLARFAQRSEMISESVAYYITEDEEGKAKAITAGVDMVNDFTSWMQRVGNYQTKSMIELSDNIRSNFGVQEAETFKTSVGQALEAALNALTTAREEINNAVSVLAGEAPAENPMGQEPMAPGGDMMPPVDGVEDDSLNLPTVDDEFGASDAAAGGPDTAGRMKRESIERGNRLMRILGA